MRQFSYRMFFRKLYIFLNNSGLPDFIRTVYSDF